MKRPSLLIAAALLATATAADAQPYKCKGPDGKIVFSDQRCDDTPSKAAAPASPAAKGGARKLSPEEQDRIAALEKIMGDKASNNEQKNAAQLEAGNIRRGMEGHLSAGDKERREALTKELASPDAKKRSDALVKLREIYRD